MKTIFTIAAAIVVVAGSAVPRAAVYAAGEPQLDPQQSAAATNGKSPDEAEKSKMEVKRQQDAQKYEGQGAKNVDHAGK